VEPGEDHQLALVQGALGFAQLVEAGVAEQVDAALEVVLRPVLLHQRHAELLRRVDDPVADASDHGEVALLLGEQALVCRADGGVDVAEGDLPLGAFLEGLEQFVIGENGVGFGVFGEVVDDAPV
jgi:hypothetical protein